MFRNFARQKNRCNFQIETPTLEGKQKESFHLRQPRIERGACRWQRQILPLNHWRRRITGARWKFCAPISTYQWKQLCRLAA